MKAYRAGGLGQCVITGCDRAVINKKRGLCDTHYRRRNDVARAAAPIQQRGQGTLTHGYRIVCVGGKKRPQHRVVMEQMIGRPLLPHESVHHKNGKRADNREENLELWSSTHPSGQRVRDLLTWAREIVALYGGLPLFE